jgi:hypothetical protein
MSVRVGRSGIRFVVVAAAVVVAAERLFAPERQFRA